jgi:transglutaminase-like putative cysteine protease
MRLRICHLTNYRYGTPASSVTQMLRLTPRNHESQYVTQWRIDVSTDCWLHQHEDAFGNITHAFSAGGSFRQLTVTAEGEIETRDTQGIMRGTVERFPPTLYLRETALTKADAAIEAFAGICEEDGRGDPLNVLHLILERLHAQITYDADPTHAATTAAEAFTLRRGVCQDLTHIFLAAARSLGIPARYVGGYFCRGDGVSEQEAGHAWAEAFTPELGWVGFDPANGICSTGAHVRVAVGLDYLGAAPLRGARSGGEEEELSVRVRVTQAAAQAQN